MNAITTIKKIFCAGLGVACLLPAILLAQPEGTPMPPGIRWGSEVTPEPGVQMRSYTFEDTGEALPYSVYVSSKIKPGEKAPLIVALRGFTGNTLTIVRGTAVDQAEAGGYILVGALGYNNRAGFGVAPRAPRPPAATTAAPGTAAPAPAQRREPPFVGGTKETDPAKVTAYSEKDVMNVLAMVRKEFNIDDKRIYLMGHSQGGGGARHIAEKYSDVWAGVALLAPAIFDVELTAESKLTHIPVMLAVGDKDTLAEGTKNFSERLAALNPNVQFKLYEGLDHGTIILGSMPEVFRFFGEHTKK
jgi:predicted esterase